jgi:hypothetical protein
MVSFETFPGVGGEGMKESSGVEGVDSSMMHLIHCKNFYKCYNAVSPSTII